MKFLTPEVKAIIDKCCGEDVTITEITQQAGVPQHIVRRYLVRNNKPFKKGFYNSKNIDNQIIKLHSQGYPYSVIAKALNASLDKVYRRGNALGLKNHKSDPEALQELNKRLTPEEPKAVLASSLSIEELNRVDVITLGNLARYSPDQELLPKLLELTQNFTLELALNMYSTNEFLLKLLKHPKTHYDTKVIIKEKLDLREEAEASLLSGNNKAKPSEEDEF